MFEGRIEGDQIELEARERFSRVAVGEDTLALLPAETFREGERLRLTVHFVDGPPPTEARFVLVVDRERADAQVEILRSRRAAESIPLDPRGMDQELQKLREENTQLRAKRGPEGLAGAIAAAWMDSRGVAAAHLRSPMPSITGATLGLVSATGFRSSERVAVDLEVTLSSGERPWSMGSAALIGPKGHRLRITQTWQSRPTVGSEPGVHLVVEAAATEHDAHGPHTLELREAGGERTITVSPVTFPPP